MWLLENNALASASDQIEVFLLAGRRFASSPAQVEVQVVYVPFPVS
jgi:hypothetical protein